MICAALLGLTAGCSGISAGKSISPLDFLIPGGGSLMRGLLYDLPPTPPPVIEPVPGAPATNTTVALVS
jgi:hypothetical protein